jgi:hypothetical protein
LKSITFEGPAVEPPDPKPVARSRTPRPIPASDDEPPPLARIKEPGVPDPR